MQLACIYRVYKKVDQFFKVQIIATYCINQFDRSECFELISCSS